MPHLGGQDPQLRNTAPQNSLVLPRTVGARRRPDGQSWAHGRRGEESRPGRPRQNVQRSEAGHKPPGRELYLCPTRLREADTVTLRR